MKRVAALVAALILVFPSAAFGHAALVRTVPSASGTVNTPPTSVALTFSEAVEPRFASISVTDAQAHQLVAGKPTRDEKTLSVPLNKLAEGWYLVYWRVISQDGHPVRGAFTFAVGPNPGPAPQFVIPSISETAATKQLLSARWLTLLAAMAAIGLFVFRALIARPAAKRRLNVAFAVAAIVALLAAPVYLVMATAQFSLRSVFDLSDVVPLLDVSAFGHGFLMLEVCLALFVVAAAIALWVDHPERPQRSIAELLATSGALLAAAAVVLVPGASGHPGTTSPRGLAIALDAIHLSAGSIWIGGLIGLLVLWRDASPIVHRFSNTALASVATLVTTGTIAALLHLPTLSALWETGWGQALLVKIGLLLVALALAARNRIRVAAPRVAGEVALLTAAVFCAAVLTSVAPPAKALADLGKPSATVGPGPVAERITKNGYTLAVRVDPNKAAANNRFQVALSKDGKPVTGATVTTGVSMLDMEMGQQTYKLSETAPGIYEREAPALVMVGRWGLTLDVEPPGGGTPFSVTLLDHAAG